MKELRFVPNKTKNIACSFANLNDYYNENDLNTAVDLLRKDLEEYRGMKEEQEKLIREKFPRILEQEALRDIDNNIAKMRELSSLGMAMNKSELQKNLIDLNNTEFITDLAIWLNKQKVKIYNSQKTNIEKVNNNKIN